MDSTPKHQQFRLRWTAQLLFGALFALLLAAAIGQSNFDNEQAVQWLQVTLIVVMMMFALLEIRRINRRLKHLATVANAIGRGEYGARAQSGQSDALGLLGTEINSMAERIESSVRQIEQSRSEVLASQQELARQNEQLSAAFARQSQFREFLADLTSIDINMLANKSLGHILQAANAQLGAFFLWDDASRHLVCLSAQGIDRTALDSLNHENALEGLPGEIFTRRKWIFVDDIDPEALPQINLGLAKAPVRCVYGMPILFRGNVLGVILLAGLHKPDTQTMEYLLNHLDALANGLNNALSYIAINRQSVQLEKANQDLRKADQLRSEFVANMSHELRTPLNSIIGFSGILLKNRSKKLDESDLKRVEKIHRNGKNLLNLINDILDLSKIEAGRMECCLAPASIVSILTEVADMLQPQAEARNLQLKLDVAGGDRTIETDEQKLRQVLINLTGNALKFTHEGGVTLRLTPPGESDGSAVIQVVDTGIGIPPDKLETIFEAFRQADSSTTREYGGTGLGLTISRSMIQLMGGTLTVQSQVQKGSQFTITLPAKPQAAVAKSNGAPASSPQPAPAAEPALKRSTANIREELNSVLSQAMPIQPGHRVLVIDDDPDARELIGQYILDLGAQPIPCSRARAAITQAAAEKPDLITLDIMMPEKNGWEILSALKAEPGLQNIPVIIISILADRRQARSLGAVDALTKPITRADFQACLERNLPSTSVQIGKVLIVDDDPDARTLMMSWLETQVREFQCASNGREALEKLELFTPDVILLDLQMPVMDGVTFLKTLRADSRFERLPVIVITAKTLEAIERKEIETQVSKILNKTEAFAL